ncbi:DNA-directed RNA polymerase II subunit RPB7 [Paramuricea clavata]|uniref:DNA-directed RNA polymerase II subunit RPB7 n=1 Tax=Paramuricea clavata TaxID=317549 RepID=A0A7D9JC07_PARCT|nr:DNA-directed RNA polymerase II subunit RPB7 [Paramuricea clavata]
MDSPSLFTIGTITKCIALLPHQMGNNILANIRSNLDEAVLGKCCGDHGIVTSIHGIENLYGGVIIPKDTTASAYFTVKFLCTLCRPVEGIIVDAQITKITANVPVLTSPPVDIIVTNTNLPPELHRDKEGNLFNTTMMKIGDTCRVRIIDSILTDSSARITTIGHIVNTGQQEEQTTVKHSTATYSR